MHLSIALAAVIPTAAPVAAAAHVASVVATSAANANDINMHILLSACTGSDVNFVFLLI